MERTVLTTGGNSGIGIATVVELARRGFRSVATVRSEEKAHTVLRAAREAGVSVETRLLDVCDPRQCTAVLNELRPYGIVNNAGSAIAGAIEDLDDAEVRVAFETMVLAPIRLARLALPHMRAQGGGRIVNVSSVYGRVTTPLTGWYQGAKHALGAVTAALRAEVASDGVAVVLVEPGMFDTEIWSDATSFFERFGNARYETAYARAVAGIGWTRPLMGDPVQVGRVIAKTMTAKYPRPRYLVGYDANLIAVADRLTPTPLKDLVERLSLGL